MTCLSCLLAVLTEVSRTIQNPNLDEAMDAAVAQEYRQERKAYEATVSEWVARYALQDPVAAE